MMMVFNLFIYNRILLFLVYFYYNSFKASNYFLECEL